MLNLMKQTRALDANFQTSEKNSFMTVQQRKRPLESINYKKILSKYLNIFVRGYVGFILLSHKNKCFYILN